MTVYRINQFVFDSEKCVLTNDGVESPLDPKLAALLCFFAENKDKVLSRDEILDQVWRQTIVSDNTINWSISQLRKSLGDDAKSPYFIKTISKKGYQFVANVVVQHPPHKSKAHDAPNRNKITHSFVLISTIGFVGLLLIWFLFDREEKQNEHTQVIQSFPLTSLPGHERGGWISSDGLYLAFIHRPLRQTRYQIHLKPLKENIQLPVESEENQSTQFKQSNRNLPAYSLFEDEFNYSQVIWGADNYQLFAVRFTEQNCEVIKVSLALDRQTVSQIITLAVCENGWRTKIALSNNKKALYIVGAFDAPNRQDLYLLTLDDYKLSKLQEASKNGAGFKFVDVNRETGQLLLLEDMYWRETSFMVYTPEDEELNQLFHVESPYYTAYWGSSPEKVWYNWGNPTVMEYDLNTHQNTPILQTTVGWNYDFHPVSDNQVIYTVADGDSSNLAFLQGDKIESTPTAYNESGPQFSPKNSKLAYVSDQSGLPQIWLNDGTTTTQITDAENYMEFYDIAWSADENSLIAVAGKSVGILQLDKSRFRKLATTEHKPFGPSLSTNLGHFSYALFEEGVWHIKIFQDLKKDLSHKLVKELPGANRGIFISDNLFVYSDTLRGGLWKYDIKDDSDQILWEEFPSDRHWEISDNNLIYANDDQIVKCNLLEINECQSQETHGAISNYPRWIDQAFSYDPVTQKVVMVDSIMDETNLRIADIIQ